MTATDGYDADGYAIPGEPATVPADALIPVALLGDATGPELDAALEAAGLPKSGKVDEKRDRLAGHMTAPATDQPIDSPAAAPADGT